METRWLLAAWAALSFAAPTAAAAFTRVQVNANVLPPGPTLDTTCWVGGTLSPQCATLAPGVSTGIVPLADGSRHFSASSVELATARAAGFVAQTNRPPGSGLIGVNTAAMYDDNVTLHLAPGATWPQTFVVRAYVKGTVTMPYYNCCYAQVKFGSVLDESYWYGDSVDVSYERSVTISQESTFAVGARLDLHRAAFAGGFLDFGTAPDSGVRFEVDLPPGLTMTSDSGVLMTQRPQAPGIVLPDPSPPPGACAGCFRFPGVTPGPGTPTRGLFDPPVVTGYEYEISSGGFALVSLPVGIGDNLYDLYVFDPDLQDFVFLRSLAGGEVHYFEDLVTRFQVRGIETSAGLDPEDPTAFVTELAFLADGPLDLEMAPLVAPECANGADDDGDGLADLADPGCADGADADEHAPSLPCDDGADNDGDTRADYRAAGGGDLGCKDAGFGTEKPRCQDGLDNDGAPGIDFDGGASLDLDGDGFVDPQFNAATPAVGAADPQCLGRPWKNLENARTGGCGLGFEVVLVAGLLARLGRKRAAFSGGAAVRAGSAPDPGTVPGP